MDIGYVNPLPVLVVAIINMVIGMIWYAPNVFGNVWAASLNLNKDELKPSVFSFLGAFIAALITAWVFAVIANWVALTNVTQGVILGFLIWLGFIATTHLSAVLWAKMPFKTYAINVGSKLLMLLVMGGILALWR